MDYLPKTDNGLLVWSNTFGTKLSAEYESLGIDSATAAEYAAKQAAYSAALALAKDPQTRGGSTVFAKRMARKDLVGFTRQVAQQIVRTMSVTDQQRHDLGLTVADKEPTPVPPPAYGPLVQVLSVSGRTVWVRLKDATGERRARPAGVSGAAVFTHVGPTAPNTAAGWTFRGNTTRVKFQVTFADDTPPGSQVWILAMWYNPTAQSSPPSNAVTVHLGGAAANPLEA